ncbi:UBX domain-containing protein 1-A [Nymphaea thermarum]|nr:UBX domain-containing protein 1-A [Nymphaea thermarum]
MAGLSLRCGDCGAHLRSVEEAQEHAELTSHSNFEESTEAVLNLVCSACGKPCRSKTESDLHTKRTGHTEFVDRTLEAVKTIDLEAPKAPEAADSAGVSDPGNTESQEMVVPDVDKKLLEELEFMGFSTARATRALHFSGNGGIEAAINWVVEHENDEDIDQMPLVPVSTAKAELAKPALTPEEVKAKAKELRERARKKKEEEEKRMEKEREKERIRAGKEILEAKRIEEENERKRMLALRKAEKEEEKRAREKIRQRIEEDKDEDAKVKRAFQTLLTYIGNVAKNPSEEKFRKIRLTNPSFQERIGSLKGGIEFLELCGFEKIEGGEFLFIAKEKVDVPTLRTAGSELNSAITNPFFGVL